MNRIKRLSLVLGLTLLIAAVPAAIQATSHDETQVTSAATGVFPPGTTFQGIPVSGSMLAFGVLTNASGSAEGDFLIVLAGTSLLGQPREITLEGKVVGGSLATAGSVTFSGSGSLNLGDGSVPLTVPFVVTTTTAGPQVTIAGTALPTQTLTSGSIHIQ